MHQLFEPLPALGLQGFSLGQSIVGTWVNSRLAATGIVEDSIINTDVATAIDRRTEIAQDLVQLAKVRHNDLMAA
jgi:hypothetical protein